MGLELISIVEFPEPVIVDGLKLTVTPAGSPVALKFTVPGMAPNTPPTAICAANVPPASIADGPSSNDKEKSAGLITSVIGTVIVPELSEATTFTPRIAATVSGPAVMVRLLVPEEVNVGGSNDAVAPEGSPLALSVTGPAVALLKAI